MITKKECEKEILNIYNKYGKVTASLINKDSKIKRYVFESIYGSLSNMYKELNIPLKAGQRKNVSKDEIIIEINRLRKEYGYVSKPIFEKHSSYSPKIVQRIFGSFSNMYKELNISRHPSGRIPTNKELFLECEKIYNEQGYLSYDLIEKYSNISITCFKDRAKKNNWNGISYYRSIVNCPEPTLGWSESPSAKYTIAKFSKILNEEPIKEKTFDWLINPVTNKNFRIDAYYPNANIAIEYNGPQHYYVDDYYTKNNKDLEYRQLLDHIKIQQLKEHKIKTIVIHFKDIVDDDYIQHHLAQ